jgi:hypothetical protein
VLWHSTGIQRFNGRPLSRGIGNASGQVAIGAAELGKRATKYLENYPWTRLAVSHGQEVVAKGTHAVGSRARNAVGTLPDGMTGWSGTALESMRRTVGRVSRAGLSSKRVARHQKRGHDVASLSDLRRLDLEQIDAVRGRGATWYYPAIAALSGAGAGLVISGGELAVTVSAGASAAPSGGAIAGAVLGDAAAVSTTRPERAGRLECPDPGRGRVMHAPGSSPDTRVMPSARPRCSKAIRPRKTRPAAQAANNRTPVSHLASPSDLALEPEDQDSTRFLVRPCPVQLSPDRPVVVDILQEEVHWFQGRIDVNLVILAIEVPAFQMNSYSHPATLS